MQIIAPLLRPKNAEAYMHREPFVEVHASTVSDLIDTLLQARPPSFLHVMIATRAPHEYSEKGVLETACL